MRSAAFVLLAAAAVLPAPLLSCAVSPEAPPAAVPEAVAAPAEAEEPAEPIEAQVETTIPRGVFASVDDLCAAQRKLAAPFIERANAERAEQYEGASDVTPSCGETGALDAASVNLGAPFLEVRAIEVETGSSSDTHLAFRTARGWHVTRRPVASDYHDDPGCPSIRRDGPMRELRVEHGTIVLVTSSSRGDGDEELGVEPGTGITRLVFWNRSYEEVSACRLEADGVSCDEAKTIHVRREPSTTEGGRHAEHVFATSYRIDARGRVQTDATYEDGF